jgi:hypothetical protein
MTEQIRIRLRETLQELGPDLRDAIAAGAPEGETHRLRKSIKARLIEQGDKLMERVGPSIFYGLFIEKGVPEKTITVKRHGRFGRGIVGVRTRMTKTGTMLVSPRRGKVEMSKGATYTRRHHVRAHPFFRPAFQSMRARIMAGLTKAVSEGIKA